MNSLLKRAKQKYNSRNVIEDRIFKKTSFCQFILHSYLNCDPCSYGKQIAKKLIYELSFFTKNVTVIGDTENDGDIAVNFPINKNNMMFGNYYLSVWDDFRNVYDTIICPVDQKRKTYEMKVSFSSRGKGNFTLRNMKPHNNMTGGYILCLIDCDDNFKYNIFVIDFKDLEENLSMTHMQGKKTLFEKNDFKNVGCVFSKTSKFYTEILPSKNKLKGTTLEDLYYHFKRDVRILESEFYKSDRYESCVEILNERFRKNRFRVNVEKRYYPIPNSDFKDML